MLFQELHLITSKPVIFCANVDEELARRGQRARQGTPRVGRAAESRRHQISAKVEAELVGARRRRARRVPASYGISASGIEQVIRESYAVLGLVSYFTAGPKEVRAWTIERGWKAPKAAAVIHTDFERGFIRAEVMAYADFVAHGGEAGCRAAGVFRVEGKDYVVRDGDVLHFRFNV